MEVAGEGQREQGRATLVSERGHRLGQRRACSYLRPSKGHKVGVEWPAGQPKPRDFS